MGMCTLRQAGSCRPSLDRVDRRECARLEKKGNRCEYHYPDERMQCFMQNRSLGWHALMKLL